MTALTPDELVVWTSALQPMDDVDAAVAKLLSPTWTTKEQAAFVLDGSRQKAIISGRRNGKSFGFARLMFYTALTKPGSVSLFVGLTRGSARDIIWDQLLELLSRLELEGDVNYTDLRIRLPNGSTLRVTGCDDTAAAERFRGVAVDLVCLDEMASWPRWAEEWTRKVVIKTLDDRKGTLCVGGTPSELLSGMFYEITGPKRRPGWSVHQLSLMKNTFYGRPSPNTPWSPEQALARAKEDIAQSLADCNHDPKHPVFVTETLGQWPVSSSKTLFSDFSEANIVPEPPFNWEKGELTLAVDFGYIDHTAFCLYSQGNDGRLTVVMSWGQPGLLLDDIVAELRPLVERYPEMLLVADFASRQLAESIVQSYGIPLIPAQKEDKRGAIHLLNADLRRKNVSVVRGTNSALIEGVRSVYWNDKRTKEAERQAGTDFCDCFLYGYRQYISDNEPLVVVAKPTSHGPVIGQSPTIAQDWRNRRLQRSDPSYADGNWKDQD